MFQKFMTCSLKMPFVSSLLSLFFLFSFQVVDHAYHLGNAAQKQELLGELYSTELQLFKDLNSTSEKR